MCSGRTKRPRASLYRGRTQREDLKPFWIWFGKERAQKITHAVMDMWPTFRKSFLAHCPEGQVVYDKFVRRENVRQELFNSLSWGAVNLSSLGG
ncbi:MAG: transposase [Leptospirillia bacterium]